MMVVVAIVLCMVSTASALTYEQYGKVFYTSATDSHVDYIGPDGHVIDANTRCYFQSGAGEYNTAYTSRGYRKIIDTTSWSIFDSESNNSGQTSVHHYDNPAPAYGKLGFYNSVHPGYNCVANGWVSIADI